MITERQKGSLALHVVLSALLLSGSFILWYAVHALIRGWGVGPPEGYVIYLGVMNAALVLQALFQRESYMTALFGELSGRLRLAIGQTFFVTVAMMFFLVATKDSLISRGFLFTFIPVIALVLTLANVILPHWVLPILFPVSENDGCLLISWGSAFVRDGGKISEWIARQKRYGITVRGILSPGEEQIGSMNLAWLGEPESLSDLLNREKFSMLMLVRMPPQRMILHHLIDLCEQRGVRLTIIHDLEEHFGRPMTMIEHDGVHLVQFRDEPLQNPLNRLLKRLLDLTLSLLVVIFILPPLMLGVWILQRIHSPGPLFFTHGRNGRGNEIFPLFKFRTMHVANDDVNRQASRNDSRIYAGGAFLRKSSLDEIPQFLNVLRGEMSIVGPRPHLPDHNLLWQEIMGPYNVRTFVKPGITGLAQTRGYRGEALSEADIRNRVECDIEYIEEWNLLLDLELIFRTAWQVIVPKKTAY
jgi:exopolysaccharide biosynthesis polyprenyl glycosylphosphotransferase